MGSNFFYLPTIIHHCQLIAEKQCHEVQLPSKQWFGSCIWYSFCYCDDFPVSDDFLVCFFVGFGFYFRHFYLVFTDTNRIGQTYT